MIPNTPQTLLRKIAEFANGDDEAEWDRFVELYEPVIRQYIAGFGDIGEADTDDIVQDIFIKLVDVLRRGGYKREKGRFRNYLAAMVRRLLIDRHRRAEFRGAGLETAVDEGLLASGQPDPATIVDMRLMEARHKAAVAHVLSRTMLDARTVAAYREYALEERPAEEVARRYNMTINNLRQTKHRIGRMIAAVEATYS